MHTIQIQNERYAGPSVWSPSTFLSQFRFLQPLPVIAGTANRLRDGVGGGEKQGTGIFSWTLPTFFHVASSREL